eukprot:TRINITY_DN4697_c1_g2_i5.p1 TRINITY_DN4697_c1_g2~~TRINITY_DN4697_c1_g2_i5.p1  ORF type:complete len:544 (+),score=195.17 TRINITY_DN4697_c1_g2_i5:95-1726(+)
MSETASKAAEPAQDPPPRQGSTLSHKTGGKAPTPQPDEGDGGSAVQRASSQNSVKARSRAGSVGAGAAPPAASVQGSVKNLNATTISAAGKPPVAPREAPTEPAADGATVQRKGSRRTSAASEAAALAATAAAMLRDVAAEAEAEADKDGATQAAAAAAAADEVAQVARTASAAALSRQGSYVSQRSGSAAAMRQGTRGSLHVPAEPEYEPDTAAPVVPVQSEVRVDMNDPTALRARVEELEGQLHSKNQEIARLEATNASLQRLMEAKSSDAKVKTLQDDLAKRAATIKKLEEEIKRLQKKAESSDRETKRLSRLPSNLGDKGDVEERDRMIRELQSKLQSREEALSAARSEAAQSKRAAESARAAAEAAGVEVNVDIPQSRPLSMQLDSAAVGAQQENFRLRQQLAEKDAERQQLQNRLDRAQDAILSSAGAGFENEVKLQQARTALQCILKAHRSPSGDAAGRSSQSPTGLHSYSSAPAAAYRSRTDFSALPSAPVYSSAALSAATRLPPPPPPPGGSSAFSRTSPKYSPPRDRYGLRAQ